MEQEIIEKLNAQEVKIDKMYASVEKMRKYFLWGFILTIVFFIVPLIGLLFALPAFMNNYLGTLGGF